MDESITSAIDSLYQQLGKMQTNALANIAHNKATLSLTNLTKSWRAAQGVDNKVAVANNLLPEMDKYLKQNEPTLRSAKTGIFDQILTLLKTTDSTQKQQLLLAIDGMFSRTTNVVGTSEDHTYRLQFGEQSDKNTFRNIVDNVKTNVVNKMRKDQTIPSTEYEALFSDMNKSIQSVDGKIKSVQKKETIAYNYGNPHDLMRPIVNPHVVEGIDSTSNMPEKIKLHVMKELLSTDKALVGDMFSKIAEKTGQKADSLDLSNLTINDGKFVLDINGKNVTIDAKFGTAFFAQCINHMVTISDINFTIEGDAGTMIHEGLEAETIAIANLEAKATDLMEDHSMNLAV